MKQYCRYCSHAYAQDDNLIWCEEKDEIRADAQITRLNRCPRFEFNPMDVLNPEREYAPREKKAVPAPTEEPSEQTTLF